MDFLSCVFMIRSLSSTFLSFNFFTISLIYSDAFHVLNEHFTAIMISLTITMVLVLAYALSESNSEYYLGSTPEDDFSAYHGDKMPELNYYYDYEVLKPTTNDVVVYPIFTQSAYVWGGIHDFHVGYCDSCLTVDIQNFYEKSFASSGNGYRILEFLGYEIIDDIDIDKDPSILNQYDKVILLHNEFVTRAEFEAITQHPNVIYLYPNALNSEIITDYTQNTITLARGPGYPDSTIENGFDWKFDNTEYFDDWACGEWEFYKIDNGHMLNCYPERELPFYGKEILETIKTL